MLETEENWTRISSFVTAVMKRLQEEEQECRKVRRTAITIPRYYAKLREVSDPGMVTTVNIRLWTFYSGTQAASVLLPVAATKKRGSELPDHQRAVTMEVKAKNNNDGYSTSNQPESLYGSLGPVAPIDPRREDGDSHH